MTSATITRGQRACTVPRELLRGYELPRLTSSLPVPRRYEETKPVIVQNLTHHRIIDLGELINQNSRQEAERLKQAAIDVAIAETWKAAGEIKVKAVKEALDSAEEKLNKELKKLSRQYEKVVKEECLKVETFMKVKMKEAIDEERTKAEKVLKETISQVQKECAKQLEEAVAKARHEEKEEAHREKIMILQDSARALDLTREKLIKEKEVALEALSTAKDKEKRKEIKQLKAESERVKVLELTEVREKHRIEIEQHHKTLKAVESKIDERNRVILVIQRKRELLYDELVKLLADYQDFIDRYPHFDPGQTGYLLLDFKNREEVENPYVDKTIDSYKLQQKE